MKTPPKGRRKISKKRKENKRSDGKKAETVNQRGKITESTTPGGYSEGW